MLASINDIKFEECKTWESLLNNIILHQCNQYTIIVKEWCTVCSNKFIGTPIGPIMLLFEIIMWCNQGQSVGSRPCDIFSFLFDWSPYKERHILLKTPPESDQWFQSYSNWKILKTIENKRNAFLFLAVSHNQCSPLLTDPGRLQHI